jgi:hypothetical protein
MFKVTEVDLDKKRHLKLTLRGISEFNQITGVDILTSDIQDFTPREMMVLIWACLMWEDKELMVDAIPKLIEKIDATELVNLLLECIINSMPEVKPETVPLAVPDSTTIPSGVLQSTTSNSQKFLS